MSAQQQQPFVQSGEPLNDFLRNFWQRQVDAAEQETPDYRHPPLPLARIKKVMKSDPDVKMIAADAPILFCKACEIFISEITARAFIIADSNKRRTLSRSDIAKALSKSDQFDFLIDIVPREDLPFPAAGAAGAKKPPNLVSPRPDDPRHSPSTLMSGDGRSPSIDDQGRVAAGPSQVIVDQLESLLAAPPRPAPSMLAGPSGTPTPPTPIDHHLGHHS